jgi:hypothetical protein
MRITIILLLASAAVCLSLYGCEKDKGPLVDAPPDDTTVEISYKTSIQPIFDTYCIRCHVGSHPLLDLRAEFSYDQLLYEGVSAPYVDTVDAENSILMQRLRGVTLEHMPPEPPNPPDIKIESIKKWIEQGAKNN